MGVRKSFLKWAGGKSKSIPLLQEVIGKFNGKLIEPFVGAGTVFINVEASNYIIGDCNQDLINLYECLRSNGTNFINKVKEFFVPGFNNKETYYHLRKRFNNTNDIINRACLFVYLNKHCFNGLCRYNKSNIFNVPFGTYKSVYFPEKEMLDFMIKLNACEIYCQDFEQTINMAKLDDVIYSDPPYVPLTTTAQFTNYSMGGFSNEQHIRLAKLAEDSCCKFLISNHDTEFTRELYKNADEILTKDVGRCINSKGQCRQPVKELLAIYH